MITDSASGRAYFNPSPMQTPLYLPADDNILVGGAETHVSYEAAHVHTNDPNFRMEIQEETATKMDMKVTYFAWGSESTLSPANQHLFQWHQGGHYLDASGQEYLTWGWWEDTQSPSGLIGSSGAGDFYVADGKIWEVEGHTTHPDYITYLQQQNAIYSYSGEVKGVAADSAAANVSILTGTFSCNIDFGDPKLYDFQIDVAGPVPIHMANGNGPLDSDGSFDLTGFTGTIAGNPINAMGTGAGGGVCGGKAEGMGGTWTTNDGAGKWATGEFHGKR